MGVIGCPCEGHVAHERYWVAEYLDKGNNSSTVYYPLSCVDIKPAAPPEVDKNPSAVVIQRWWKTLLQRWQFQWLMDARKKAEYMRRVRAANKIRGWWFWLWGDDIQWTMYTNKQMETDVGAALVDNLISTPVNHSLVDEMSDSKTPPDLLSSELD